MNYETAEEVIYRAIPEDVSHLEGSLGYFTRLYPPAELPIIEYLARAAKTCDMTFTQVPASQTDDGCAYLLFTLRNLAIINGIRKNLSEIAESCTLDIDI